MSYPLESVTTEDSAFGPETDLILSLLVIVLLVGVLAWYQGNYLVRKKEEIIKRTERKLVFQEKASTFKQGSAEIGSEDERQLLSKVGSFINQIRAGNFQYLEIAGATSPEVGRPSDAFDVNLVKGYERARSAAEILHSGGLPYECMKLSSYGRSTSEYLNELIRKSPEQSAKSILKKFDSDRSAARESEKQISGERRTEIWGIPPSRSDDGTVIPSVCSLLLNQTSR